MGIWAKSLGLSREALIHSLRTAVATVLSLLLARSLKLPEFYWAPISTIVILLSPTNPRTVAWQRFAGTALGAALGALVATFFSSNWIVYAASIFVCGLLSSVLRLGNAYRFAAIALTIVLLITHLRPPWSVALYCWEFFFCVRTKAVSKSAYSTITSASRRPTPATSDLAEAWATASVAT